VSGFYATYAPARKLDLQALEVYRHSSTAALEALSESDNVRTAILGQMGRSLPKVIVHLISESTVTCCPNSR
jgi:hypothetical protein